MAISEDGAEEVGVNILPEEGFFIKGNCEDCPLYNACPRMKGGGCKNPLRIWVARVNDRKPL
jgi:hypothetical protein